MGKEILNFGDVEIKNWKIHAFKNAIAIGYLDISKILVGVWKVAYGKNWKNDFKFLVGCVMIKKLSCCASSFCKWMNIQMTSKKQNRIFF